VAADPPPGRCSVLVVIGIDLSRWYGEAGRRDVRTSWTRSTRAATYLTSPSDTVPGDMPADELVEEVGGWR
jgi:hypothetical protein